MDACFASVLTAIELCDKAIITRTPETPACDQLVSYSGMTIHLIRTDSVLISDIDIPSLSPIQLTAPSFVRLRWPNLVISWKRLEFGCCILPTIDMVNLWQIGCHVLQCDPWWLHTSSRQCWTRKMMKKKRRKNENIKFDSHHTMDFRAYRPQTYGSNKANIIIFRRNENTSEFFIFNILFSRQIYLLCVCTKAHASSYTFQMWIHFIFFLKIRYLP